MFYPQAMTQIRLIIPARDLLAVTRELADQGIYHQVDGSYLSAEHGGGSTSAWQEKAAVYAAWERRVLAVMQALDIEEGSPPSTGWTSMIETDAVCPIVEPIEQELHQASEQMVNEQKKIEQLESFLNQLEPLADVDVDVNALRHPQYLYSILGILPAANIERLKTSLARIPFVFLTLRQEDQKAVAWLAGTKRNAEILDRAARSAYLNPLSLPEAYQGTWPEIIHTLRMDIELAQERLAKQRSAMTRLHQGQRQQLQTLLWCLRASRILAEAIGRFGRLHYTYLIVGWVPSSQVAGFAQRLRQVSQDMLIETFASKRGSLKQIVPVALNNPKILRPFQQLVTTYARPLYEEVDPTFLTALTFPFLFGAMFGDVGQGVLIALLGALLASRKIQALRSLAGLGELVTACGLAATLFGFLYGSAFGFENVLPALWIRPMNNVPTSLAAAIGVGVVLLSIGLLISVLNAWTKKDWGGLLFDAHGIAGLALYWSLVGLAIEVMIGKFPIPPLVLAMLAILAGLGVMFSEALKRLIEREQPVVEGGLGTYIVRSVFELFETLISLLSNSISYVRVGAFAVAHMGLSAVIFILAELIGPGQSAGYWIVIIVGNLFIIGFEGVIVGIQAMRLEYYELFSKFFTGGGMRYEPLTLVPKVEE